MSDEPRTPGGLIIGHLDENRVVVVQDGSFIIRARALGDRYAAFLAEKADAEEEDVD